MIFSGNIYHRVYVMWLAETVSEEDQKECQETPAASLEEMVYTDFISAQVNITTSNNLYTFCVISS